MKSYHDKKILFSLLALGVVASFVGAKFQNDGTVVAQKLNSNTASVIGTQAPQPAVQMTPLAPAALPSVTLGFVGDIMMARGIRTDVQKNFGGDYSMLFKNANFLKTPDIMFANLEGPVSDVGTDKHNLYSFRMDPEVIPVLKAAGIDVVSVANNHMGDWGRPAFEDTIARLKAADILPCGGGMTKADAVQPAVVDEDGFKVGFLCFSDVGPSDMAATDTQSGILLASDPNFDSIVKTAASQVDALVVSFHWGVEYQSTHTARQEALAKEAINDGAVMVEGEHPHVSEDTESYDGVPIFYSLGNFIFDQAFSKQTMQGLFLTATLSGKTISNLTTQTVVLDSNFVPSLEK